MLTWEHSVQQAGGGSPSSIGRVLESMPRGVLEKITWWCTWE